MINYIHELGELFHVVQRERIFRDSKTFPDCIPKSSLDTINEMFFHESEEPKFDLKKFVAIHFDLPLESDVKFDADPSVTAKAHIEALWPFLTRRSQRERSSLIQLPHPYVVPGGRFREIYYWDSYFTMLGLEKSGKTDLIENMVDNFSHLIDQFGYIPNGNRSYFLGRSQPPFYSLMVKLLSRAKGKSVVGAHKESLEKEYKFWMTGASELSPSNNASHRVVLLDDGAIVNRYWDENGTPRPEAYLEDVELSLVSSQEPSTLFRNLRAAAESGWDFSSRWYRQGGGFDSIHTTEIIPVDLNCLLYHLERTLAEAHRETNDEAGALRYEQLAEKRKLAIRKYCWNDDMGFFYDFDFREEKIKTSQTLAAAFPLFFQVATTEQAQGVATILKENFLKSGGFTTTLENSGQQWDAPNGWAPLQWITYQGLVRYGFEELAHVARSNWLDVNMSVYQSTGKMTEKYDVLNENLEASGGEYPNQDGFGWTNGVFLAMLADQ